MVVAAMKPLMLGMERSPLPIRAATTCCKCKWFSAKNFTALVKPGKFAIPCSIVPLAFEMDMAQLQQVSGDHILGRQANEVPNIGVN